MCQLLGMNCNTPTDIMFSFEGFRRRGGITDHHADGFGIGFFEGKVYDCFTMISPAQIPRLPTWFAPIKLNLKTSSPTSVKPRKGRLLWPIPILLCAKCGANIGSLRITGI